MATKITSYNPCKNDPYGASSMPIYQVRGVERRFALQRQNDPCSANCFRGGNPPAVSGLPFDGDFFFLSLSQWLPLHLRPYVKRTNYVWQCTQEVLRLLTVSKVGGRARVMKGMPLWLHPAARDTRICST